MGEHDHQLRRFQPALRYDSMEQFFADSAAQWTDNPGNELRRAETAEGAQGALIATPPTLCLDFLGEGGYGDQTEFRPGDRIGYTHKDYRERYFQLRQERPELRNRMYGRAVEDGGGQVWLQYWFFYFYNDYNLALGKGLHEGDWEMIQLRLYDGTPDVAVYAQHRQGEKRDWDKVERAHDAPDTPVVYVARGSHASYFECDYHETDAWYDMADGERETPPLELEIVTDTAPPWIAWRGIWGDTRIWIGGGVDQPSPDAPCAHPVWDDPNTLLDDAREPQRKAPIEPPSVVIVREPAGLRVDFDFTHQDGPPPVSLQVTVNSRNEHGVPPRAYTFDVTGEQRGTRHVQHPVDPTKHYDVHASTTAGDPPLPSASKLIELEPVGGAVLEERLGLRVVRALGRLLARLRGDRT